MSVSIDLDEQLKISAGTTCGATDSPASAVILQQQVPRNHAGQPLLTHRQPMLTGDKLYVPHDARPDDGASGDGGIGSTAAPTELEQECLYISLSATAAAGDGYILP